MLFSLKGDSALPVALSREFECIEGFDCICIPKPLRAAAGPPDGMALA
jgi:hypothetical protein